MGTLQLQQLVDEDLGRLIGTVRHRRGLLICLGHVKVPLLILDNVAHESVCYLGALFLLRVHLGHFVDKVQLVPRLEDAMRHDLKEPRSGSDRNKMRK